MSTPLPTTSTPQTAPTVRLVATPEQQRVLDRIELQRERLRARRLIRWAGIVLPMLMRLRR